jgi:hypothetical protein
MVVGIVAAIAIPYAAPQIASSMMLSGVVNTIGMTATSAITGAVLGGTFAAVTGGDWKMGALAGGVAGGIGGYNYQGPGWNPSYSTGAADAGGLYPGGVGNVAVGPASVGSGGLSTAGVAGYPGVVDVPGGAFGGGFDPSGTPGGFAAVPQATFVTQPTAATWSIPSGIPSGAPVIAPTTTTPYNQAWGVTPRRVSTAPFTQQQAPLPPELATQAAAPQGFSYDQFGVTEGALGAQTAAPGFFQQASNVVGNVAEGAGNLLTDVTSGVGEFATDVGDRIVAGITPERVQQGLGKLATSGFAKAFEDSPQVTPEEEGLRGARDEARANEARLLGLREDAAGDFLREAKAINPVYSGQQALTEEQNRLARAQEAGRRAIDPRDTGAAAVYQQQSALKRSRLGGFARAYDARTLERERKLAQGIGLLPTGSELAAGAADDIREADARYKRMQEQQVAAGGIFSTFLGDLGTDTEEERKKRGEGIASS